MMKRSRTTGTRERGEKVTKNERLLKERKTIKYGDDEIWSKFIFHSR